jgi:transcriptional regulator of acetoin/glycerol metabolism
MNGLRDVVVQQDRFTRTERPPGGWRPIETSWGGQFRADLHYRLNVFPVEGALRRERRDDIALLVQLK